MNAPNHHPPVRFCPRVWALCRKECWQIIRDPSSALIAFVIPLLMLFIYGYGINLDANRVRIGIWAQSLGPESRDLLAAFSGSPYLLPQVSQNRQTLMTQLTTGEIRGIVTVPSDFDRQLRQVPSQAILQVITDGSEPNTASFVEAYVQGVWQQWLQQRTTTDTASEAVITVIPRYWFNSAAISRHFIMPSAISIIMTVIGAILTSLVIAREWERGTMESLLACRVNRRELLCCKLLPYYGLGMLAQLLCIVVTTTVMDVPFRGSWWALFGMSSLFLCTTLGMGLLISSITRNQFNAAMIALNVAFLPSIMLSGFVFEIRSMPLLVQGITYLVPARYFVTSLHSLFLAGTIPMLLLINALFLLLTAFLFLGLTVRKTRRHLDG